MVAFFYPQTLPNPTLWRSKGQNSSFSEHGHVAYKIKWNREYSNMVANILPAGNVKIHLLQSMVMLHIKLN